MCVVRLTTHGCGHHILWSMPLSYLHYDVFTGEALLGNQLAVFTDARGLDTAKMQRLAREMNFSESTFILPAERSDTDIRMRIFTPMNEMPMAGHPTIGSTFALAQTGVIRPGSARFVFGLNIGPVPVDLEWNELGAPVCVDDAVARRRLGRSSRTAPPWPLRSGWTPRIWPTICRCRKCRAASRILLVPLRDRQRRRPRDQRRGRFPQARGYD